MFGWIRGLSADKAGRLLSLPPFSRSATRALIRSRAGTPPLRLEPVQTVENLALNSSTQSRKEWLVTGLEIDAGFDSPAREKCGYSRAKIDADLLRLSIVLEINTEVDASPAPIGGAERRPRSPASLRRSFAGRSLLPTRQRI